VTPPMMGISWMLQTLKKNDQRSLYEALLKVKEGTPPSLHRCLKFNLTGRGKQNVELFFLLV